MKTLISFETLAPAIIAIALLAGPANAEVILDNTLNGTNSLSTNLGSISVDRYQAKIFTTPSTGSLALDGMKMALYSQTGNVARTVSVDLKAVDGSNNPTGSVLATESFVLNLTSTPTYYDIDLNAAIWGLSSAMTYALVFSSDASSSTTSWTQPPSNNSYSMSGGFTFVGTRRTNNSGSTWSVNTYNNGLQLSVAPVSAVPEIDPNSLGSVLALVLGSLGMLERRRLKAA
jgi:hypothetical protein